MENLIDNHLDIIRSELINYSQVYSSLLDDFENNYNECVYFLKDSPIIYKDSDFKEYTLILESPDDIINAIGIFVTIKIYGDNNCVVPSYILEELPDEEMDKVDWQDVVIPDYL